MKKFLKKHWAVITITVSFVSIVAINIFAVVVNHNFYRTVKDNMACELVSADTEKCTKDEIVCFVKTYHYSDFLGTPRKSTNISCNI